MNQKENKKRIVGRVTSLACEKTATVIVETMKKHPIYKKMLRRSKKYLVHNTIAGLGIGDIVEIESTRPISKNKHNRIVNVIRKQTVFDEGAVE